MEHARKKKKYEALWLLSILVLALYPLRHVNVGVDLWDGGYNYANFRYSGLEYMDAMWYFATWLANTIGSLLVKLPFGDTVLAMNIYTGLIVSITATVSYFFCVRIIRISAPIAFVGELAAISLCWDPTAVLYNYLTYLFLLVGICLLYRGLMLDKGGYLIAAGVVLGLNVGNRFSNLVQTALIVAVWAYGAWDIKKPAKILRETGLCILGYAAAVGCLLLVISVGHGLGNYAEGIRQLFQMTENATDYTPGYMLKSLVQAYIDNSYWTKRFVLLFGCAFLICLIVPRRLSIVSKVLSVTFTVGVMAWLGKAGFYSRDYAIYGAIYAPCVIMFELTLFLSVCKLFDKKAGKDDRLFYLLLSLTIAVTSLGGNNAMYSSINNTFLAAPGFLWMVWRFCRDRREILAFPMKCVLCASTLFVLVQCAGFGRTFVYEEATGGRHMETMIREVPALSGMRTEDWKAEALTDLYQYLESEELRDRECILYGNIPGTAFYMDLAPAMNVWSDLRSYRPESMERDLGKVRQEIQAGELPPLVILESSFAGYVETRDGTALFFEDFTERKLLMICELMEEYGYREDHRNEKFVVYRVE